MKLFLTLNLILINIISFAQVGINTSNPQGVFHVDAARDNNNLSLTDLTNTQKSNDVIFKDNKLGVGTLTPAVELDIRASTGNKAIGIGTTSQTVPQAGKGAIRYNNTTSMMEFANGITNTWTPLISSTLKTQILAINDSNITIVTGTAASTNVTNWTEVRDNNNSFDPVTGKFVAPNDGVYMVTAMLTTAEANFLSNSQFEIHIQYGTDANNANNELANSFKSLKSIPSAQTNVTASAYISGVVQLTAGQIIKITTYQVSGSTKTLKKGGYNRLSIIQL